MYKFQFNNKQYIVQKYKILSSELNPSIAVSTKQNDILASSEAQQDQLEQNKCLKENFTSVQRAKDAICVMSFILLDVDVKQ